MKSSELHKPARRRPRRPSIDDFALLDYQKESRRQSLESKAGRKSKDDMDVNKKRQSNDALKKRAASTK
eukprot:CAMPEP_0172566166 /NCGR_PEP_ID=MMETSP1067-20121228/110872_1 /TAXON_ID=265564 ORGANISM="Thalassiosira punctigera, Strain Tpunct2005C2" /NCGR_SAMPLE_ID=MMETSP1067 /ASSEMBLY_ACC=CAM_ASM_000444 /LENGTH=68 /DNA_ID=CAMNT_0013357211 /DNA_START=115 /DNA_END=318 /DNA_ORIENTATION=-